MLSLSLIKIHCNIYQIKFKLFKNLIQKYNYIYLFIKLIKKHTLKMKKNKAFIFTKIIKKNLNILYINMIELLQ